MFFPSSVCFSACYHPGFFVAEVKQDTLRPVGVPPGKQPTLQLSSPALRPQLDLERAQEVIENTQKREQQVSAQTRRRVEPVVIVDETPPVEIDSLMVRYMHVGCVAPVSFPDTIPLTVLEHYLQSSVPVYVPALPTDSVGMAIPEMVSMIPSLPVSAGMEGTPRITSYSSIVTILLILSLALFAWLRLNFGQNLLQAFHGLFSFQQTCRVYEERRESDRQASFYSNILFAFNVGIFLLVSLPFFGVSLPWNNYGLSALLFSLFIGLVYIIKAGVWSMLGSIFMIQALARQYIYNMYLFNRNLGLLLFPFIISISFLPHVALPYAVYGAITMIFACYILKVIRIFQIIHAQNIPGFYFILYLCTLEFLPILLFAKICKIISTQLVV